MGWIEFLFRQDTRPRIPHHLVTPYDESKLDEDDLLILMAGKSRDLHYIDRLMRQYGATSRIDLLKKLPKRKRTPIRQRIRTLIARWEGALPYDPIRREVHEIRRAERLAHARGIRRTRMH